MELTIALNRYDRHVPFFNGTVAPPPGITLKPLEIGESMPFRDGSDRHARLLNDLEFDIGEMGLSSFVMAVARDPNLPIVGIPSFPRRFFSAGQIYVNSNSNIRSPEDLTGKRVGVHSFQTTLSVLAKGDLKLEFGVKWEDIDWYCMRGEVVPVDLGDDVSVQVIPADKDIGIMLMEGEIDALISHSLTIFIILVRMCDGVHTDCPCPYTLVTTNTFVELNRQPFSYLAPAFIFCSYHFFLRIIEPIFVTKYSVSNFMENRDYGVFFNIQIFDVNDDDSAFIN